MGFYVTLPSNSSMRHYPDNSPSHFFTKLPQTFELASTYEVGLAEIQFPMSFLNVETTEFASFYYIAFKASDAVPTLTSLEDFENNKPRNERVIVPSGLHETSASFVSYLNELFQDNFQRNDPTRKDEKRVKLFYDHTTKKVHLKLYEDRTGLILSPNLQRVLGFSRHSEFLGPRRYTSDTDAVDVNEDLKTVFVYCDVVRPRPVGDAMVPLLRTVPLVNKAGEDMVYRIYEKPHYVPLSRFQFDTMEILLTTDSGKKVPFQKGKSVVTLHFRQQRSELL